MEKKETLFSSTSMEEELAAYNASLAQQDIEAFVEDMKPVEVEETFHIEKPNVQIEEAKPQQAKKKKKVLKNLSIQDKIKETNAVKIKDLVVEIAHDITREGIKLINVEDEGEIIKYVQDPLTYIYTLTNHKALYEIVETACYEKGYMISDAQMKQLTRLVMHVGASETFEYDKIKTNILTNNALIRFADGKVQVTTQEPEELKNRIALRRVNIDYKPELVDTENPLVEKFLLDIMCGDKEMVEYLLNALATCFVESSKYETAFFFYGPKGSNGKSTLEGMFRRMIGSKNISGAEFSEMAQGRGLELMDGKLVNWVPDMEKYSKEQWTVLKKVTSGEKVTIDRKFIDPVEKEITAQIFVNTNTLPKFGAERDGGKDRRVTIIPFLAEFKGNDKNASLRYELREKENIEWLFAQLIARAANLMGDTNGTWFYDNKPKLIEKAKAEQVMNDSSVIEFLTEKLQPDVLKEGEISIFNDYNDTFEGVDNTYKVVGKLKEDGTLILSKACFYKEYKLWARNYGYGVISKQTVTTHMEELGFIEDKLIRFKLGGLSKQGAWIKQLNKKVENES